MSNSENMRLQLAYDEKCKELLSTQLRLKAAEAIMRKAFESRSQVENLVNHLQEANDKIAEVKKNAAEQVHHYSIAYDKQTAKLKQMQWELVSTQQKNKELEKQLAEAANNTLTLDDEDLTSVYGGEENSLENIAVDEHDFNSNATVDKLSTQPNESDESDDDDVFHTPKTVRKTRSKWFKPTPIPLCSKTIAINQDMKPPVPKFNEQPHTKTEPPKMKQEQPMTPYTMQMSQLTSNLDEISKALATTFMKENAGWA